MEDGVFIWLAVTLLFDLFAMKKPFGARIVLGLFFIVMALGVNLVIARSDAGLVAALGADALIPFYRWAFREWVAAAPLAFIVPIILLQLAAGVLMLGRGTAAKGGLAAATLFLVLSAPLHEMALPNLLFAVGTWILLRGDLRRGLPDMLHAGRGRSSITVSSR